MRKHLETKNKKLNFQFFASARPKPVTNFFSSLPFLPYSGNDRKFDIKGKTKKKVIKGNQKKIYRYTYILEENA